MIPRLRLRVLTHKTSALTNAPAILQRNLKGGLLSLGQKIQASSRTHMRKDTGAEQKDVSYRVTIAGLNMNLIVFATVVQAFVDAYGLKRGTFPDFRVNSKLYNWVKRRVGVRQLNEITRSKKELKKARKFQQKNLRVTKRRPKQIKRLKGITNRVAFISTSKRNRAKASNVRRLTYLVARAIFLHGIKAGGWTKKTLEANKSVIISELQSAMSKAVQEIRRA